MVALNKGAVTRMDNTIKQGKRNQMTGPGADAAKQSLKNQVHGPAKSAGSPVGNTYDQVMQPQPPMEFPTGGTNDMPRQPDFDPAVFKEDVGLSLLGNIKTHQFLNSPAAKDAQTSVQLKEIFNQFNTNKKPDPRSMADRVVNRMGLNREEPS